MESDFYGEDSMHVHVAVTRCHIAQILSDRGSREVRFCPKFCTPQPLKTCICLPYCACTRSVFTPLGWVPCAALPAAAFRLS